MPDIPRLGAIAVVPRAGRVLLVRRSNPPDAGLWGYPGGHVELGETGLAAAARELHEETSVRARPLRYLMNLDLILRDAAGEVTRQYLLAAVLCEYVAGEPAAADDVSEARWVPVGDVLAGRLEMSEHVDEVLRRALRDARR